MFGVFVHKQLTALFVNSINDSHELTLRVGMKMNVRHVPSCYGAVNSFTGADVWLKYAVLQY